MPASARRALGAVIAVLSLALAALGAWTALKLGPSGEARFSATSKATGAIVVEPGVLNSIDLPVRIKATRVDGGAVWLAAAQSADVGAVLAKSAVSTVSGVRFPSGTVDLRVSGAGALPDISTADIWRISAKGAGSAELVVDQSGGPESAVVTSGDATPLTNVTVTLSWAQKSWFFMALAATVMGVILASVALIDVSNSRRTARWTEAVRTRRSRVRA